MIFLPSRPPTAPKGYKPSWLAWLNQWWSRSPGVSSTTATLQKSPSLRNNNGSLQVRVRIDGRDAFINRLGRWSDPVAVAKAHAIAAQIWSDYCQGTFDRLPGVNYVGGSRQLRRRVGTSTPLPWQGGGARFCWGLLAGN